MRFTGGVLALGVLSTVCQVHAQDDSQNDTPDDTQGDTQDDTQGDTQGDTAATKRLNQYCNHLAEWEQCNKVDDAQIQCATIRVPRDWGNIDEDDEIDLHLIRYAVSEDVEQANEYQSIIINTVGTSASYLIVHILDHSFIY